MNLDVGHLWLQGMGRLSRRQSVKRPSADSSGGYGGNSLKRMSRESWAGTHVSFNEDSGSPLSAAGMERCFSRTELPTISASPLGRPQTRLEAEEMDQEQAFEQQAPDPLWMAHALIGGQLDSSKRPEYSYGKPTARRASLPAAPLQPPFATCRRASLPAPSPLQIFSPARRASLQREHAAALEAEYAAATQAVAMEDAHMAERYRAPAPEQPHMLREECRYDSVRGMSGTRFHHCHAAAPQQPPEPRRRWSCFEGAPFAGGQAAAPQHWRMHEHHAVKEYPVHANRVTSFESDTSVYMMDGGNPPSEAEAAALEAARRMHAAAMYGHQAGSGSPPVSLARVFDW